jgi:hypothetical protein
VKPQVLVGPVLLVACSTPVGTQWLGSGTGADANRGEVPQESPPSVATPEGESAGSGGAGGDAAAVVGAGGCWATGSGVGGGPAPQWQDCDGDPANGAETDTASSEQHCGACNDLCELSCATPNPACLWDKKVMSFAKCIAGSCQEVPMPGMGLSCGGGTTFWEGAIGEPRIRSLAVDAVNLYFSHQSELLATPKSDGQAATVLAAGESEPVIVGLADGSVYFFSGGVLKRVPTTGGAVSVIADLACGQDVDDVRFADGFVYFGCYDALRAVPEDGGDVVTVGAGLTDVRLITVTDGTMRFAYTSPEGLVTVAQIPVAGGTPQTLVTLGSSATGIAIDASDVYWVGPSEPGQQSLWKMPLGGGPPIQLSEPAPVWGGWLDGAYYYFAGAAQCSIFSDLELPAGRIYRVGIQGGPYRPFVGASNVTPTPTVSDETKLYYGSKFDGCPPTEGVITRPKIYSVPK